jgi:putative tryptophan/tyrosine transport system substrate-binding protein
MRRRDFVRAIVGSATTWPLAGSAQQSAMPVIGFLSGRSHDESAHLVAAFQRGLGELGYIEGQSVTVEYRWADGQYDRLPMLATELARRSIAVVVTTGGTASAVAAKAVSPTIPIVFNVTEDPVKAGLVDSLSRPGRNATGVTSLSAALDAKRFSLLHDAVPEARVFAMLVNPDDPAAEAITAAGDNTAHASGYKLVILKANKEDDIDAAFANLDQQKPIALIVIAEPFFITRRVQLVKLAAQHSIPTIYGIREFATSGGLMSYGIDVAEQYRQTGIFAGKILKGTKPADLPVLEPTKFEFVINLRTAKALGLILPPGLVAIADEVIE